MRIIHWNISYNCDREKVAEYVSEQVSDGDTVICLQEVSEPSYDCIRSRLQNRCGIVYSLNHRRPGKHDGRNRHLGVMVICPEPMYIIDSGVLDRTPFPDRTAYAEILFYGQVYRIISLHSVTGCDYSKAKSAQFRSFAEAIEEFRPDIVTIDANEPERDHYDVLQMGFFDNRDKGEGARSFFRTLQSSNLSDAYSVHYDKRDFVEGEPLALSHMIHGKDKRRYDFVFVNTSRLPVQGCVYQYGKGRELSSDHAIITAGVELRTRARTPDEGVARNSMYPYDSVREEHLLKFCRYFKGGSTDEGGLMAEYERHWVQDMLDDRKRLMDAVEEHDLRWLETFNTGDGVPLSLKAILFNRYFHWNSHVTVDDFRRWYLEAYLPGEYGKEK